MMNANGLEKLYPYFVLFCIMEQASLQGWCQSN